MIKPLIKLSLFLTGAVLMSKGAIAQANLVRNPGFDTLRHCPSAAYPNLDLAVGWRAGSPEGIVPRRTILFNSCADSASRLSVPYSLSRNYQPARSGTGYTGLYVCNSYFPLSPQYYLEFAQNTLYDTLKAGATYYVEFFTTPYYNVRRESSSANSFIGSMGLAFSDSLNNAYSVSTGFLNLKPAIRHPAEQVIKDTGIWQRVNGRYTAKGNEAYALIGNFVPSRSTYVENVPAGNTGYPYYFIEDAGVYQFDPLPDTLYLCAGEPRSLNGRFLDGTCRWSTGSTDSVLDVTEPGLFWIEVDMHGVILRDSTYAVSPESFQNALEESVCSSGRPVWLSPPLKGAFEWSTGSTERQIPVSVAGRYTVSVIVSCGRYDFTWDVAERSCDCDIFVPTAFSPNADGRNDFLRVRHHCDFELGKAVFRIYNRWGQCVYLSSSPDEQGWDGSFNGIPQPVDTYYWVLSYSRVVSGSLQAQQEKGDVVLLR